MNMMEYLNWIAEHPVLTVVLILSVGVSVTIARNGK